MNFAFLAATAGHSDHALPVFFAQMALLITFGRLLGELLQRVGQPPVMGQLLAGVILGPSVFGAVWPAAHDLIFPTAPGGQSMLKAVSELGVLMLLLLTGMETDIALVKRIWRPAALTSIAGVVVPFTVGYMLGEMLPADLLPDASRRVITSLFLATALSISSVKIVAVVLRETGFLRRNLGQLILASAILDDTIGWTLLALIGGLAAHGAVQMGQLLFSVVGTIVFLLLCFTVGRSAVAWLIRWANDRLMMEMPVISLILVIMLLLSLVTNGIGVHTVLGAFMAGIMIGQSPILTRHIDEQLRGLIVALFMPVFFGVAGLSIDLKVLADPRLLGLTGILILVASFGKLGGCYIGSRLAGLHHSESFAVGCGMNARGSTEVILATIGLSMGALNQELFTIIVMMAVLTTLAMPPTLRWALNKVPIKGEEKERLENENARENEQLPSLERVLVALDESPAGQAAARLGGMLLGARRLSATVIDLISAAVSGETKRNSLDLLAAAKEAASSVRRRAAAKSGSSDPDSAPATQLISVLKPPTEGSEASDDLSVVLTEAAKGYDALLIGRQPAAGQEALPPLVEAALTKFEGISLILMNAEAGIDWPLHRILAPSMGADFSRLGTEVAIGIAKGAGAVVTALHVSPPREFGALSYRREPEVLPEAEKIAKREGVRVEPKLVTSRTTDRSIVREASRGRYQLIVLGIKSRPNETSLIGPGAAAILKGSRCPVLLVKS